VHPGDLKFPGRSAQHLPIFLQIAPGPAFVCSFVKRELSTQATTRYENGGTPVLLLPYNKRRSGGGEQPGRRSLGDGGVRKVGKFFFFKEARKG